MADTTKVDEFVFNAVKTGTTKAGKIVDTIPAELVQETRMKLSGGQGFGKGERDPMRTVDKSLQRLRRAGKISYDGTKWEVVGPDWVKNSDYVRKK